MAALMLETPVVTTPIASETFDEVWLGSLRVNANNPEKVRVSANLIPARTNLDGSKSLNTGAAIEITIDDFFTNATVEELTLMYELVSMIKARAGV